jgi:putative ABC transport system permease protein
MLPSHFRFALRVVSKYKVPSFINFLGFTVGLTGAVLLLAILLHDARYDAYHKNSANVYRLSTRLELPNGKRHFASTSVISANNLAEAIPEITDRVRIRYHDLILTIGEEVFNDQTALFVDSGYYKAFTTEIIAGQLPKERNDIVINETSTERLFGQKNPVGQIISSRGSYGNESLKVVGVFKDYPTSVSFRPEILADFRLIEAQHNPSYGAIMPGLSTFLVTGSPIEASLLNEKLNNYYAENLPDNLFNVVKHEAEPFTQMHFSQGIEFDLGQKHDKQTLWILAVLAAFILISTLINFFNMQTAMVMQRTKELSIKQVLGITRGARIKQQIFEGLIVLLPAFALSGLFIDLGITELEAYTSLSLGVGWLSSMNRWVVLAGLFLVFWLITTSLSLIMTNTNSHSVISQYKRPSQTYLRSGLIGLQFILAGFFIFNASVISDQIRLVESKSLGYQQQGLITLYLNQITSYDEAITVKTAFSRIPGVKSASISITSIFGDQAKANFNIRKDTTTENHLLNYNSIDQDFADTHQLMLLYGENVSEKGRTMLVNEQAVKNLGFNSNEEALGQMVTYAGRDTTLEYRIGGIVSDYHYATLHQTIEPIVLMPNEFGSYHNLSIRTELSDLDQLVAAMETKWHSFFPGYEFNYRLMEDTINRAYEQDYQKGTFYQWATMLLVFVSAMGIFGLTYFYADQKRKEIGIRKAIGAELRHIIIQIGKPIALLCIVSSGIVLPLGFYLSNQWLEGYQYHISIGIGHVVFVTVLMFLLAAIALIYPGIKANRINPVEALREQ